MTSLDTIYEYAGFKLAGTLSSLFAGVGLPLIVALAGVAYVVHSFGDKGGIKDLGVYVLFLVLAAWLLSSTDTHGVPAPRFLGYLNAGADQLQARAVRRIHERFLTNAFEWERLAALASLARVRDAALGRDLGEFLESCAKPALARAEPRGANLFREGTLAYREDCEERRKDLWARLQDHVRKDPVHRTALDAARARDPANASAFLERYTDEVAIRAVDDPGGPTGEAALVVASLGEYGYLDPSQSTGGAPWWLKTSASISVPLLAPLLWMFGDEAMDVGVSGVAQMTQAWENRFTAKQKYYLATIYGPHVYGLSLMLILGLFPVAGLFALAPGKWKVFVNYGKVYLSVKLWPVAWAVLTSFNARRSALEAFDPGQRATESVFFAVSAMYLLTPALCFAIVHLATAAASLPFAQAVPPPSGPGLGPAGPVVAVAARGIR